MSKLADLLHAAMKRIRDIRGGPVAHGSPTASRMRLEDAGELTSWFSQSDCCPDCGGAEFVHGPRGGLAQNMKCGGCGSEYNIARYEGRPITVDRIYRDNPPSDVVLVTTHPERAARVIH
jgi:hypothetical protein